MYQSATSSYWKKDEIIIEHSTPSVFLDTKSKALFDEFFTVFEQYSTIGK